MLTSHISSRAKTSSVQAIISPPLLDEDYEILSGRVCRGRMGNAAANSFTVIVGAVNRSVERCNRDRSLDTSSGYTPLPTSVFDVKLSDSPLFFRAERLSAGVN